MKKYLFPLALLGSFFVHTAQAATFTVTTTADTGAGSLRRALANAQATTGGDLIVFDDDLNGQTISLASVLGTADADGVTVDATLLPNGMTLLQATAGQKIFFNTGKLTLRGLTLTGGAVSGERGGAIQNNPAGTLTLEQCTLSGNSADVGGALWNDGVATISQSTISNNSALYGSAIENASAGTMTLVHSTIYGNDATAGGDSILNDGTMTLRHCTLAGNLASSGSGAIKNNAGDTLTIENCILGGGNDGTTDLANEGTLVRVGANLAEKAPVDTGAGSSSGPAVTVAPPLLGALASNGGPTQTLALQAGSPAIDAAVGSTEAIDQRGAFRPVDGDGAGGAAADLGATERGAAILASLSVSTGTLSHIIAHDTMPYTALVPATTGSITVTPILGEPTATVTVNGVTVTSGNPSGSIPLVNPDTFITLLVTAQDGGPTKTYYLVVKKDVPDITVDIGAASPGRVAAWGAGTTNTETNYEYGQSIVPVEAQSGVVATAGGLYSSQALKGDGSVVAWGRYASLLPAELQSDVTAIACSESRFIALKSNGEAVMWGPPGSSLGNTPLPSVPVAAQSGVVAIGATREEGVVLKNDGSVLVFGGDVYYLSPMPWSLPLEVPVEAQSGVTAIAVGWYHALALKSGGRVVALGADFEATRVPAEAQSGVVAIAANERSSAALKSDGSVIVWGASTYGELTVPPEAQSGVSSIAAGASHLLALKRDGSVIAWGFNGYGGATVPPEAQSGVTFVGDAQGAHSLAINDSYHLAPNPLGQFAGAKILTIRNDGTDPLLISEVSLVGADPDEFKLNTTDMLTNIPPGGQTTFKLSFISASTASRSVTVRITSNDPDEGTYDFTMVGSGTLNSIDTDGDGLSDAVEVNNAAIGLDFFVSQPEMASLYNGAHAAGQEQILTFPNASDLYTTSQIQALNVGTPLLQRDGSGQFKLTIGVEKSTTLLPGSFGPFPFTTPNTTINGEGKLEFLFTTPDDAAFFRLQSE